MKTSIRSTHLAIDADTRFQSIDGFGVNINSKYWKNGRLAPAVDALVDDLGATLFRVDVFGKSDWIDPAGTHDASILTEANLAKVYQGDVARSGWGMMKHLNKKGISPYFTISGMPPRWMCGADGKTLTHLEPWSRMVASVVEWARKKEGISYKLFGPLNETDLGPPDGPFASPEQYAAAIEMLDAELARRGLDDIRFVVAEQSKFDHRYVDALMRCRAAHRIAVFGMHCYGNVTPADCRNLTELVKAGPCADRKVWMTEYGDLEQTGEREWFFAWIMTTRLFDLLEGGFSGAMAWDAFDNYHDHDDSWTLFGLLRTAWHDHFTPKKRYYATKQVFRFVPPQFRRVSVTCNQDGVRALAFTDEARTRLTIVLQNTTAHGFSVNGQVSGVERAVQDGWLFDCFRTSLTEDCVRVDGALSGRGTRLFRGDMMELPPESITTFAIGCGDAACSSISCIPPGAAN